MMVVHHKSHTPKIIIPQKRWDSLHHQLVMFLLVIVLQGLYRVLHLKTVFLKVEMVELVFIIILVMVLLQLLGFKITQFLV